MLLFFLFVDTTSVAVEILLVEADHEVVESIGQMHLKLMRSSGARGHVAIPYKTIDGTARGGRDYIPAQGEIVFPNDEHEYAMTLRYSPLCIKLYILKNIFMSFLASACHSL